MTLHLSLIRTIASCSPMAAAISSVAPSNSAQPASTLPPSSSHAATACASPARTAENRAIGTAPVVASSCCHRAESATGSSLVCARGVNRTRVRRATYKKSSHEGRQLLRKGARSHPRVPLAACGARPARRGPLHLVRRRVRQRARARQQPGLRRRAAHAPRPSWPHARALAGNTARLTARPRQGRRPGTRAGRPREDGARLEALAEGGGAPRRVLRAVRPRERLSAGT